MRSLSVDTEKQTLSSARSEEDGSEGSFNEKGRDSSEKETTSVNEEEEHAYIAEELHSKQHQQQQQQQQQELRGENETSNAEDGDGDHQEPCGAVGGEPESGERTKNATSHSPSGAVPKRTNVVRTTDAPRSRKTTANHADETKPGTSAWRKRTNARVLPMLCDDGQEIDVLDGGDLFSMGEKRGCGEVSNVGNGTVDNGKSGCGGPDNGKSGLSRETDRSSRIDIFAASSSADDADAAPSYPLSRQENSSMWPSRSDEKVNHLLLLFEFEFLMNQSCYGCNNSDPSEIQIH